MSARRTGNESRRSSNGDDPVAIRLYARSVNAALDVATLESHGIAAEISGDTVSDTLNLYGLIVQKVELIVPRRKAAEARQILADLSAGQSANQRMDWVCSGCGEVNGSEFDSCWSCSKTWSAEHDQEFVAETIAQPLPTENDPVCFIPEEDPNLYAPPIAGTLVLAASGVGVEKCLPELDTAVALPDLYRPEIRYSIRRSL